MKFTSKQYSKALHQALESTKDTDRALDNFVQVLAENNDLKLFEDIASEFHKADMQSKGVKFTEVVSAHPTNSENDKLIVEALNRHIKSSVELNKKLDENLIGGVVIQADDLMIDASVKNSLEQLKINIQE